MNNIYRQYFFLCNIVFYIFTLESFFLGNKGQHDCPGGASIIDKSMCLKACTTLGLSLKEILGDFACYKDHRGHCFQNDQNGGEASMVCENTP